MVDFREVAEGFWVAPQLAEADVAAAAERGVRTLINNRPDGEEPGQPTAAELRGWAEAHGLAYHDAPAPSPVSMPGLEGALAAQREVFATAERPVLAFCRTGTRSIMVWALDEAASGRRSRDELVALGAEAGYDLSRLPL